MVQWVKPNTLKPDKLSSIPGTHTVEAENGLPLPVLKPLPMWCGKCVHIQTFKHRHTQTDRYTNKQTITKYSTVSCVQAFRTFI